MNDSDELLDHARRYFGAAAESTELRKMQLLVSLGTDYLRLAAGVERSRGRRRKGAKQESQEGRGKARVATSAMLPDAADER